jgi:hypothetical protein
MLKWAAYSTNAAEFWTVLPIYCHVPSWASHVKSHAIHCFSLSLSLSLGAPSAGTSYWHGRWRLSFLRFCASTVTCPLEPIRFSCLYSASVPFCWPPAVVLPVGNVGYDRMTISIEENRNLVAPAISSRNTSAILCDFTRISVVSVGQRKLSQ